MSHRIRRAVAPALAIVLPALWAAVMVVMPIATVSSAMAQADPLADFGDPVETINARFRSVPDAQRAEMVLMPAIGAMDDTPEGLNSLHDAMLLTPALDGWTEADAWAGAGAQRAALDAMRTVTELDSRYQIAILYGAEHVDSAIRDAGYFPMLTNDTLLAGAEMRHLDGLENLLALCGVEAERLAAGGQTDEALDLLIRAVRLARMTSDRAFFAEKLWGIQRMIDLMEAMRDILYRYPDGATAARLTQIVEASSDDNLLISRILLPEADRLAALQVVRDTFDRFGQPNLDRFGPAMAMIADAERPLARFGEASWWRRVAANHAGYYDTIDAINDSFNDWTLRWALNPGDPVLDRPSHYQILDPALFAAVRAIVPDCDELFEHRTKLRVAQRGTRTAFAVMAYKLDRGVYPSPLFAVRPRYIQTLPLDPHDPRNVDPYQYFVPIRDQPRGDREAPRPHEMQVVMQERLNPGQVGLVAEIIASSMSDAEIEAEREAFMQFAVALVDSGGSVNLEQQLGGLWQKSSSQESAAPLREETEAAVAALAIVAKNSQFIAIADAARNRRNLSVAQIRQGMVIVMTEMLRAALAAAAAEVAANSPDTIFTVRLDDSVFVLYSIGEDERSGFATSVGPGGADALIWPPLISIERDRLRELGRLGN